MLICNGPSILRTHMQRLQINNCFILVFVTVEKANAQWGGLGRQWGGKKESMGRVYLSISIMLT